ncbi:DUF3306 domain-containing protein [Halomonas sp. M4R1S46]|uniref:DUF3306 domain-containing protein n=1 Tax=Halomonas sp. M4R1S46 TaxID=2982692 RepID=UPI0021E3FEB9|nr:DUF3306 domain-containing protein [Halomonas sp. M4R1S46]UYG09566.1 DUF3306 domain-containing protein [Halomonas sp. M4R1S46]
MSHFQRWSRRKRGVIGDDAIDDATASAAPSAEPVAAPEAPPTDPEADLPDPDDLPPGSDITAFMAPGVSAGLRRRALKRLFAADHYGIRDGLDDYDQDFRRTLTPLAGQAAQRLRRWLDEPDSSRDDDSRDVPREVADDATPPAGDEPRDDGNGEIDELTAAPQPATPPARDGDAPLDQGPLARTGKPIKTR